MSVYMKIHKVNTLPTTYEPSCLYMVKHPTDVNLFDLYVSSNDGLSVRKIISKSDIQNMISTAVGSVSTTTVVPTIAARDALNPTVVTIALVLDATADPTVTTGAATYVYNPDDGSWTKISEYESLDIVLQWANIVGKPSSAVADIDDAVTKKHTHTNKTVIDALSEDGNGLLNYKGQPIYAPLSTDQW